MVPSDLTKKVLEDFIEIYRTHPCLWQIKNKEYHDRDKKESAYKLLLEKLREIEPDANKAVVVKKINNLSRNVRKEKKKYDLSLRSGTSPDDVYCIKLWYYDLFNFIHDQCTPQESSSNLDGEDENSCEVNAAFEELRIRARAGSGRLPKLEILRAAIQHIERLQAALRAAAALESDSCKTYVEPTTKTQTEIKNIKTDKERPFLTGDSNSCGLNSLARLRCIVQALASETS